ncbi:MAG TPA: hypothetical protein ENJ89_11825 [Caldithrix abyssi]|uniref:Uncharacterized protein n=1 Tax=Caldithrix abyssi TaxID=187145 RepID=A0A7V5PRF7_CALAY|nr:hypothetical protein [Caldithrix abyssi]
MLIYVIIFLLLILLIWGILIYVRKSLWDTVHRNLLDLEDAYGGHVLRRSFLNRPYYHGQIKGVNITINFSSEKREERVTYIDVSLTIKTKINLTLSTCEWLQAHGSESQREFEEVQNSSGKTFLFKISNPKWLANPKHKAVFDRLIDEMEDLAYLFVGKTGLICEWQTKEVANHTRFEHLDPRIKLLLDFGEQLKNGKK